MKKVFGILLGMLLFAPSTFGASSQTESLSDREIADLVRPSVVKIVQHVQGQATIPKFNVSFKDLNVSIDSNTPPSVIPIDEYISGTGVIISPDGEILTNSHVISYQTVKNIVVGNLVVEDIAESYMDMSSDEAKQFQENQDLVLKNDFGKKIVDFALNNSKFDIKKTVTVLNPSSQKDNFEDLAKDGFNATVLSVNDNFYKDDKDAALIKIEVNDLPSLALGNSDETTIGKNVFIFGFPQTATFNEKDFLEPTFTKGTVGALKDSINKDFKVLQTDAKISQGSSGGPLIDENAEIVGIVSFLTGEASRYQGDSFAFAIPINTSREIVQSGLTNKTSAFSPKNGNYEENFRQGLIYLHKKQAKKALDQFSLASKTNPNFKVDSFIQPYVAECNNLIASGNSIDSKWDQIKANFSDAKYLIFIVFAVTLIVFVFLGILIFRLRRRLQNDENELDHLEEYVLLEHEKKHGKHKKKEEDYFFPEFDEGIKKLSGK